MSAQIHIPYTVGEPMSLFPGGPGEAVWVLSKRRETEGPFWQTDSDSHQYPIIKFEHPPEFCGIDEPSNLVERKNLQLKLRKELLDAVVQACKQSDITTILVVGADSAEALPYKDTLALSGIALRNRD